MGLFGTRAASFTWNAKGECFGVLMSKDGQSYKVLKHWHEKASNPDSIAPVLQKGYTILGVTENDYVVIGEMGMKCSFVDFIQPAMNAKDMKKSLSFSLSSHFPMDPADLHWCYRNVSEKKQSAQVMIRLLALKSKVWNDWLDHTGTIKVDQFMAPSAVCDAVIKDPVYIPFNNEKGFLLSHNEEGKLQSLSVFEDELDDDVFGAGDDPLDHPSLDSSGLNDLNSETAQKFSQAVLLAMYGLSPFLNRDKESSFEIPKALTPKRNVVTKSLCAALAIFLLMLGIFHASRIMALKKNEAAKIDARISSLKKEARMNMVDANTLEDLTVLHEEMMTKIERPTSAKAILVVLTETLPEDFHLTSFSVRNERISCKVRVKESSDKGSEDLYNIFKKEDFFDKDIEVSDGSRGEINLALKVAKVVNHENLENN